MLKMLFRDGSRSLAAFKMELFLTIVNDWEPLSAVMKNSIIDVAGVLFCFCHLSAISLFQD